VPDTKYQQDTQRFECLGLDLNRPVDSVKPGKYPLLTNVRAFQAGRIEPRDGLSDTGTVSANAVHSCRRLNNLNPDDAPGVLPWTRIVGAGTELAMGQGPYGIIEGGYSGDPLALVPYRTDQSPTGFMYVADRLKMRKVCIANSLHPIGLPAPNAPPFTVIDRPLYRTVVTDQFASVWTFGGPNAPGGPVNPDRLSNLAPHFTTSFILPDQGASGWTSMTLSNMNTASLGKGLMLGINIGGGNQEYSVITDVFPGDTNPGQRVNIASIIYDSGAGGGCSIQLSAALQFLQQNCLLYNYTKTEYIRVLAIIGGPDHTVSIRAITLSTFAPGDEIAVVPSIRLWLANSGHVSLEPVSSPCFGATFVKGTGTVSYTPPTTPVDLTQVGTDITPTVKGTRPLAGDDFMHVAIIINLPDHVTEIQAQLDVNADPAYRDFKHNYYYRAFRSSDLTPNTLQMEPILTTSGTVIQNQQLQNPQAPRVTSQQLLPGNNQWVDLKFRISDLIRVGADASRSLQSVMKLQFTVTATADVQIMFNSWWVGGSYTPDTFDPTAINYKYRYRARISDTGVTSNWSPAMIDSTDPERMQVKVNLYQYKPSDFPALAGVSLATTDIVLDVQRYGGELAEWHYVGTTENTATPVFTDNYADDTVAVLPSEDQNSWQPWPIIGLPVESTPGAIVNVSGITVTDSTAPFQLNWAPGTVIKIAGIPYTIYRVVSTTMLQLVENAGAQSAVGWRIDDPTILGQPLPCLWGDEQLGAVFACGDIINPGRLYFSNGNNPDATRENNYVDITSPSEPLMNGVVYNLRSYVFSSERMFQILPTGDLNDPWHAQEIPNGKGLFSRWGITRTPSPIICFLGKDGINATTGGAPQALTDADLYEYFPNEGNPGAKINGLQPPDISAAQAKNCRLDYYDEYLYFDFVDVMGSRATLVLAFDLGAITRGEAPGGWFYDFYTPGIVFHYGEEGAGVHSLLCGGSDGRVYQYTVNMDDAGSSFVCIVRTMSRDQGDPRSNKLYGDVMVDSDTKGVSITASLGYNNYQIVPQVATLNTGTLGRQQQSIPAAPGSWYEARNIALNLSWTQGAGPSRPLLYIWEPRYTFSSTPISVSSAPGQPSAGWSMSPSSLGLENWKHINLVRISHKSVSPIVLTMVADGVTLPPITIPASGGGLKQDVFRIPVQKFKLLQASITGTGGEFSLDSRDSYFDIKEWGSDGEYRGFRLFGDFSMVEG